MNKITYDKLDAFGDVVKGTFRLLYPNGLTMDELEQKAQKYNWLRLIYERFNEV